MYEFRMPSLGADMEAGILSKWLVKPGYPVKRGDVVAVIETEKSDIEVEIFASGVVNRILIEKGQKVPVGTLLATLTTDGEAPSREAAEPPLPAPRPLAPSPTALPPTGRGGTIPERRTEGLRASPAARRRARELGIDLAAIAGTGPAGAVTLDDVEKAAAARPAAPSPSRRPRVHPVARKMSEALGIDPTRLAGTGVGGAVTKADVEAAARATVAAAPERSPAAAGEAGPRDRTASMRRAIAAAMARSKREIPHYYLATEIDVSRALVWLAEENRRRTVEERLLPAALLLKAVALALREVPELNGLWVDGAFRPSAAVHLGVAISVRGGGLIAPAIHDAEGKTLGKLMAALRDLVQRARAGSLRSSEVSDPTVTVTNLGDQGVETVFGVIYPPQVALVGLGRIVEKPWAESGLLGVRPVVTATLSADHRVSDGHRGALFLAALERLLQAPEKL
jgi:pyruvate dehydrogenase E2 component (dihydrolipoyllysine-residue acetyltransferase)